MCRPVDHSPKTRASLSPLGLLVVAAEWEALGVVADLVDREASSLAALHVRIRPREKILTPGCSRWPGHHMERSRSPSTRNVSMDAISSSSEIGRAHV